MSLKDTLATMLTQAAQHPGQTQIRRLNRGLTIRVKIINETTTLGLSRASTIPSLVEWRTVLRALPYPMTIAQPLSGLSTDRQYTLWAEWPTPTQEQGL